MSRWTLPAPCSAIRPRVSWASASRRRPSSKPLRVRRRTGAPGNVGSLGVASPLGRVMVHASLGSLGAFGRGQTQLTKSTPSMSSIVKNQSPTGRDELAEVDQVRMLRVLQRPELLLEAQQRLGIEGAQGLQRDLRPALGVERLVHHAHPTLSEGAEHLEAIGSSEVCSSRFHARRGRPTVPENQRPS
jgi:hypothetical protein